MNVTVIGPGALGCLFTVRLMDVGAQVTLVDHRAERAARLRDSGLAVVRDGETRRASPAVCESVPSGQRLIIVLTKANATRTLRLPRDCPVLTLQNGLGNAEALADRVGPDRVLAGATSEASTLLSEGRVRHAADGETVFGPWTHCPPEPALELFRAAGFRASITRSPATVIWEKAIVSSAINPLTALLDVSNGELEPNTDSRALLRALVLEATRVAASEGYLFDHDLVEKTERICRATATNVSSMRQDVRAARETEIESIAGEVLRRAKRNAVEVPVTQVVYRLIKAIEHEAARRAH